MKFIIVGFGRVGMRTARILRSEGHDVVVDRDGAKIDRARNEGFAVVQGDANDEEVLERAGLDEAASIAGLTGDINTNYAVCVVGNEHGCRTVLRISEEVSDDIYEKYAEDADEIIYPERVGAAGAKTALLGGDFNVLADLTETLSVASVTIPDGSPAIDQRVVELDLPGETRVYAHGRADESMTVPLPQTRIRAGDTIAVMAAPDALSEVRAQLRGESAAV